MSKYYETIVNENYRSEELFYKIFDYYLIKHVEGDFNKLDEIEKNFLMVGLLLTEVNSGGFDFYFIDAEGEKYARQTLDFLNSIDEKNFSTLLNKATEIFESEKGYDEKFKELGIIDDEFYKFRTNEYNDLYEKCIRYLKNELNKIL
ncbi:DUF4375 domain-containing protein [Clostridium sp. Sa3CUN1]|uniref:DUF4375 domain-containing protein n=1 Tax=Clostridium gallinarum TaxID=2762246 RepID=A0ABR8Q3Z3_9CLOT|nr:DUF4375 domain-containing protein [Clostridium gallinarum]MBD7915130.1 DUF4375 domain-containing protein [Clostridium gallinarum]